MPVKIVNMYRERKQVNIVHTVTKEKRVAFLLVGNNELPEFFTVDKLELSKFPKLLIRDTETRRLTEEQLTASPSPVEIEQDDTEIVSNEFAPIEDDNDSKLDDDSVGEDSDTEDSTESNGFSKKHKRGRKHKRH